MKRSLKILIFVGFLLIIFALLVLVIFLLSKAAIKDNYKDIDIVSIPISPPAITMDQFGPSKEKFPNTQEFIDQLLSRRKEAPEGWYRELLLTRALTIFLPDGWKLKPTYIGEPPDWSLRNYYYSCWNYEVQSPDGTLTMQLTFTCGYFDAGGGPSDENEKLKFLYRDYGSYYYDDVYLALVEYPEDKLEFMFYGESSREILAGNNRWGMPMSVVLFENEFFGLSATLDKTQYQNADLDTKSKVVDIVYSLFLNNDRNLE